MGGGVYCQDMDNHLNKFFYTDRDVSVGKQIITRDAKVAV